MSDPPLASRQKLVVPLADAIRTHVAPGMHLHLASTSSRSNAAIRELARTFLGTRPGFTLSSTGFHSMAHLLPRLGLADRLIGCFFGDHYPAPRPNPLYNQLEAAGVALEHWPLWTLIASLRAGAQGDRWVINRSLHGTTMARDLAARGHYRELTIAGDPQECEPPERIAMCAALRPDIAFVHAAAADEDGNVLMSGPLSEGPWSALAARRGAIVTVERLVPASVTRAHRASIVLPPHRVLAICEEPFGAHPQPLLAPPGLDLASYRDDFEHYERWRTMATDDKALADFVDRVLRADDGAAAYRAYVGGPQLARLQEPAPASTARTTGTITAVAPVSQDPRSDALIVAGARQLARRAVAIGAQVMIAGIGHAFFAARLAQQTLAADGYTLRVMVETGLYDLDCGPDGHGYLLAYENMSRARRTSAIDDILGVLVGGANNRCLAALGAAQIDADGNLNSTRVGGRLLIGSGGACDIAALAHEAVVITRLSPGRLVDELEYITSPGHAVRSVVTDRCVLARHRGGWEIDSVAAGAGPAREPHGERTGAKGFAPTDLQDAITMIERDCAWPLQRRAGLAFAPAITAAEAQLLTTLDPTGKHRHRAG